VPKSESAPPEDEAQLLGSVIDASTVPVRDAAQLVGGAPVRMRRIGEVPMVSSTACAIAVRTVVLS
jgi:hypothetical protein